MTVKVLVIAKACDEVANVSEDFDSAKSVDIIGHDLRSTTHTGAVGRFRCTRVGSSSSSSGSESGFSYIGRSSVSDSELSSISSIEMILDDGWAVFFELPDILLLMDLDGLTDDSASGADADLRSSIKPRGSLTLVRLLYHCPSELFISSVLNAIRLSFGSANSENAVPTTIPKNLARCDEAARRFDTALR